jgi:hypothetical protein
LGRFEESLRINKDASARSRQRWGEDDPETIIGMINVASVMQRTGSHQEAAELLQDAHARLSRVLGPNHPQTLQCAVILAGSWVPLNRHGSARQLLLAALARATETFGPIHNVTIHIKATLIMVDARSSFRGSVNKWLDEIVESIRRLGSEGSGDEQLDSSIIENVVEVLRSAGRMAQARLMEQEIQRQGQRPESAP